MPQYCAKCGSEVAAGQPFCASCGAPTALGGATLAAASQPVAISAKAGGNTVVKIVLIVVAIFVGLGILGAGVFGYTVWRISRAVHMSANGSQINLPGGSMSTNSSASYTAAELGTEIYPGAQPTKRGMRMTLPTGSMVTGVFFTNDSKDQVVAFYKSKLGAEVATMEAGDAAILTLKKGQQESVMVTVSAKSSQYQGKTQISIVHTISKKDS